MKILLVIDLQKELSDEKNYIKILQYIKENRDDYDKVIGTIFVNNKYSRFVEELCFKRCMDADDSSIEYNADVIIKKSTYGVDLDAYVSKENDVIYIIGCDSDACIMATAFLLFDKGYDFIIKSEFIYTTANKFKNEQIIEILKRNFGKRIE